MRHIQNILIALLITLLFTACGSDDKDDSPSTIIETITGQFIDSPVEGLSYTCSSSQTGVTNSNGEYTCNVGDTVSFSLGNILLGEVEVADVITPFTLFSSNEEAAINFAQLIQTLDSDGNPTNGIKINEEILATLNTVDFSSFSFDEDIQISLGNNIVLVDATKAQEHLNESFASLNLNLDGTPIEEKTTANFIPVANAGVDKNVAIASTVTLDGSTSSDFDGDALTYSWNITSAPTGSNATLSYSTTVNPTFVADLDGSYVLSLVVNDGTVNSTTDTVTITSTTAINLSASIPGTTRYFVNEFGNTGYRIYGTNNDYTYVIGSTSGSGTYSISDNTMTLSKDTRSIFVFIVVGYTTDEKGIEFSLSVNGGDAFRTYNYINEEDRDAASY